MTNVSPTNFTTPAGDGIVVADGFSGPIVVPTTLTTLTVTGVVTVAAGTVGAPEITFAGDTDTGIYRIGANSLGIAANGVLQATFNTTGINGILGGTTPAAASVTTLSASGSTTYTTAAAGTVLKQGANGRCGTFTCNGATPVTVSNTSVAVTDAIIISLNTVGGTVGAVPAIQTITGATGFTVAGTASDTSVYNYAIIKNAA